MMFLDRADVIRFTKRVRFSAQRKVLTQADVLQYLDTCSRMAFRGEMCCAIARDARTTEVYLRDKRANLVKPLARKRG